MKKISQLDPAQPLSGAELLEVVQNGRNYRTTVSELKGKDGLSTYELAVRVGFEGSLEEWLDSIKGLDGTRWFIADGTPDPSLGIPNDFAIDRVSGRFYLKHSTDVWIDQGILYAGGIAEAPDDSKSYVRKDAAWTELSKELLYETMGFVKDGTTGDWLLDSGQLLE